MISIGATAVIFQDNTVLLVKREDFEVWALPDGVNRTEFYQWYY